MNDRGPLSLAHADTVQRVRVQLDRAGYTDINIREALETNELSLWLQRRRELPKFLRRTRNGTPLDTFIRVFLLQQAASLNEFGAAIVPMRVEEWVEVGLLQVTGERAHATVELTACQGTITAGDWPG